MWPLIHIFSSVILISWRFYFQTSDPRLRARSWNCDILKAFPRRESVYFRIKLQEISPRAESEVMTQWKSVPVQYHNTNTPLLWPYTNKGRNIFPAGQKMKMTDEWCVINLVEVGLPLMYLFSSGDETKQEKILAERQHRYIYIYKKKTYNSFH